MRSYSRTCALLWLLLAGSLAGCATLSSSPRDAAKPVPAAPPEEDRVQLRYASLPQPLRPLAVHYWFIAWDHRTGQWNRWEVWQAAHQVPTSWGHIHKDLMPPDAGVGGGPCHVAAEWHGATAQKLRAALNAPEDYPDRDRYRAWPGPNSNTYVAWVLRRAGVACELQPRAIGKDYRGWAGGGISPLRTGAQFDTPVVGLEAGLREGVEAHALCLTFGVRLWPPAIKTPLGALGAHSKPGN